MKKIEAIIRQEKLEDIKEAIQQKFEEQPTGMTVSQVLGFGHQKGMKDYVRGQAVIPAFVSKVMISFLVDDQQVDPICQLIVDICQTGAVGDGKIFIYPVEEAIRIRTGERGAAAI